MGLLRRILRLFKRSKKAKVKQTAEASNQTEERPTVEDERRWCRDLLTSLHRESAMLEFFERRGLSWPTRERLPWKVKLNNIYPDLSEFLWSLGIIQRPFSGSPTSLWKMVASWVKQNMKHNYALCTVFYFHPLLHDEYCNAKNIWHIWISLFNLS